MKKCYFNTSQENTLQLTKTIHSNATEKVNVQFSKINIRGNYIRDALLYHLQKKNVLSLGYFKLHRRYYKIQL